MEPAQSFEECDRYLGGLRMSKETPPQCRQIRRQIVAANVLGCDSARARAYRWTETTTLGGHGRGGNGSSLNNPDLTGPMEPCGLKLLQAAIHIRTDWSGMEWAISERPENCT
jgi:hypothetical protein